MEKPNQALQFDSGRYYYIEDWPKKPCKDKCESSSYCLDNCEKEYVWNDQIKSTRIEVAPESVNLAEDLIMREIGMSMDSIPDGIFPVHLKVKIVEQKIELGDSIHGTTDTYWIKYAILSEPDKDTITPQVK